MRNGEPRGDKDKRHREGHSVAEPMSRDMHERRHQAIPGRSNVRQRVAIEMLDACSDGSESAFELIDPDRTSTAVSGHGIKDVSSVCDGRAVWKPELDRNRVGCDDAFDVMADDGDRDAIAALKSAGGVLVRSVSKCRQKESKPSTRK